VLWKATLVVWLVQVLALTTGLQDMRERLGRMVIGSSRAGRQWFFR
jgi:formyltetrahydrofolate synthetase